MKGFEKEKNKTPNPLWVKVRFYVLILGSTALLLTLLLSLSHGEKNAETLIPAGISLTNAILAYLVSKREQGKRSYKQLMKNLRTWTIARFVVMAVLLVVFILTKIVEPLPFIFTFIGFYILHQVIEITVMQKELK
jgi:F0F1-type ATP synthase assembly protein I